MGTGVEGEDGRGRRLMRGSARMMPVGGLMTCGTAAVALLFGASYAVARAVPNARPAAAGPQSFDVFRQQTERLGVRRCANLFSAAGQMTTAGSTYAVQVQANRENPNAHATRGVVGITYDTPDLRGQAAGVVMAAPVGQGCEGQLVRVAPFQKPCAEVLGLLPAGSTPAGKLMDVPLYNLGGNRGQAMLVSSGSSCVVVTVAPVAGVS